MRRATMDVIYRERANGRFEYWTYSDGCRIYLSASFAEKEIARKTYKLIIVK